MSTQQSAMLKQRAGIKPGTPDDAAVNAFLKKYPTLDYISVNSGHSFTSKGQPGAAAPQAIMNFVKACQDFERQGTTSSAYQMPQGGQEPEDNTNVLGKQKVTTSQGRQMGAAWG